MTKESNQFGYRDDSDAGLTGDLNSVERKYSFQLLRTKGMRWTKSTPRSLYEVSDGGVVVWNGSLTDLEAVMKAIGPDSLTALTSSDLDKFPMAGLSYALNDTWRKIVRESGIINGKKTGFIGINPALLLYAAFLDNDYWPNTERGGH